MNNIIKKVIIAIVALGIIAFAASYFIKRETKKNSPQAVVEFKHNNFTLKMVYCQPYKKGRLIFGTEEDKALQPFGKYWRLGANEATTLETNKNLIINGNTLKKGIYSIYAVPGVNKWKFSINAVADRWGANEPDYSQDLFTVEVEVNYTKEIKEQLEISIDKNGILFWWDTSKTYLPFEVVQ